MAAKHRSPTGPIRLAIWYGKGGVGKSTTTLMLSLLAARRHEPVLAIDLDPECGSSRDFLGTQLPAVAVNLQTFLESPLPVPPPIIPSGIDCLDLLPCAPDQQRFFRHYPEHSTKLRDALALLPDRYRWILMDVPNQFDNVAELGLIAADYVLLPVELTADCCERVETALASSARPRRSIRGSRYSGPSPLAPCRAPARRRGSRPRSGSSSASTRSRSGGRTSASSRPSCSAPRRRWRRPAATPTTGSCTGRCAAASTPSWPSIHTAHPHALTAPFPPVPCPPRSPPRTARPKSAGSTRLTDASTPPPTCSAAPAPRP